MYRVSKCQNQMEINITINNTINNPKYWFVILLIIHRFSLYSADCTSAHPPATLLPPLFVVCLFLVCLFSVYLFLVCLFSVYLFLCLLGFRLLNFFCVLFLKEDFPFGNKKDKRFILYINCILKIEIKNIQ